ncbi:MAG: hypothetical protein FJX76_27060 [Armatimonadetes bacterium]|nr:hypothetical protein [Armatimonadota bacterium]
MSQDREALQRAVADLDTQLRLGDDRPLFSPEQLARDKRRRQRATRRLLVYSGVFALLVIGLALRPDTPRVERHSREAFRPPTPGAAAPPSASASTTSARTGAETATPTGSPSPSASPSTLMAQPPPIIPVEVVAPPGPGGPTLIPLPATIPGGSPAPAGALEM